MRSLLALSAAALLCSLPLTAEEEEPQDTPPPTTTHHEVAWQLVKLLQDTEACLASCTDEASVQAALPRLRELAARATRIKEAQNDLPDPTKQDYTVDPKLLAAFNEAWKSIRRHISRLEQAELLSPDMRDILRVEAP